MEEGIFGSALILLSESIFHPSVRIPHPFISPSLLCSNIAILREFRETHVRIADFAEVWIGKYLRFDFYTHFRKLPETFEILLDKLRNFYIKRKTNKGGEAPVPIEKAILMTLWYLAKGDILASIGDRFNVANSTACTIIEEICIYICNLSAELIKWPNYNECLGISQTFQELRGFPNVIGAIDCCHITVQVPSNQHESYLDRKFNYSIVLQAICTADKLFTNIFVGYPGAAHDAKVLKSSSLYQTTEEKGIDYLFYEVYHLLGDSAYPCKTWLLTPYRRTGRLTPAQTKYNEILSATRVKIENCFGLLLGRWRVLRFVNVYSIQKAVRTITACCVLHNFCLLNFDFMEEIDVPLHCDSTDNIALQADRSGVAKREEIASYLSGAVPIVKENFNLRYFLYCS